jgi:Ca2+-binding RTX toxin-like protein
MIDGGPEADSIVASQIADTLLGCDGNNGFKIESFDDAIDAGMGRHRASIFLAGEVAISDDTTTFTMLEFLRVEGSDGNDIVHASGYSGRLRFSDAAAMISSRVARTGTRSTAERPRRSCWRRGERKLRGQDGDDSLDGGEVNDFLSDGIGADILLGGSVNDRFG